MFYLETRDGSGKLNNMQIIRLKDKLGTRQLPTAELLLDGVIAHKVSKMPFYLILQFYYHFRFFENIK